MASSSHSPAASFLMFLCLRLLIIVPLISKGIVAPYSRSIDFKVTEFLQCKSHFIEVFFIYIYLYITQSLPSAMASSLLQCLSDIMPVENGQKDASIGY